MSALVVDLERLLTMQSCLAQGLTGPATFEVHVRHLPPGCTFLVAAGLEQVLQYLKSFSFSEAEHAWLVEQAGFSPQFLEQARTLRFDGDVDALAEGSVFFADEPVLRLTATLPLAQFLETRVLNLLQNETAIATWAARAVLAAGGRRLYDYGLRSAASPEAGLLAARACYLAGFDGTSSADAARRFRIPLARSLAEADGGPQGLEPETLEPALCAGLGAAQATPHEVLIAALAAEPHRDLVRLVGGDLATRAQALRRRLDAADRRSVRLLASGPFDIAEIATLAAGTAPLDGFATTLLSPHGAGSLTRDMVYLLRSTAADGTAPAPDAPGRQVWRRFDGAGRIAGDTVCLADEPGPPGTTPLLAPSMRHGRRLARAGSLDEARAFHAQQRQTLPAALRGLDGAPAPAVEIRRSDRLVAHDDAPQPAPASLLRAWTEESTA